jgi:hypothetical protein
MASAVRVIHVCECFAQPASFFTMEGGSSTSSITCHFDDHRVRNSVGLQTLTSAAGVEVTASRATYVHHAVGGVDIGRDHLVVRQVTPVHLERPSQRLTLDGHDDLLALPCVCTVRAS